MKTSIVTEQALFYTTLGVKWDCATCFIAQEIRGVLVFSIFASNRATGLKVLVCPNSTNT